MGDHRGELVIIENLKRREVTCNLGRRPNPSVQLFA